MPILHMCSVAFEQHAVIPVEGSLPPETDAVGFVFWQIISLRSCRFGAGRVFEKHLKSCSF